MSEAMPQEDHQSFERDQVVKIINSVIEKVEHKKDDAEGQIFNELRELQKIIEDARSEIGSMRPSEINDDFIPTATDELDAIVESTAEATGTIMDACEVIQEKAAGTGDAETAIVGETMKIFEACSFQDITGQRITKVVKTLKDIESKVTSLMAIVGTQLPGMDEIQKEEEGGGEEVDLLEGPQLPGGKGISQDEIDKLLEDF